MAKEDTRQDDEVYRLLGMLFVSISCLEHCLDRAILSINDTHPDWLLKVSPKPPTSTWPKINLLTKFVAEDQLSLGIEFEQDFKTVMGKIFEIRNVLLHGSLQGWNEPIEHPETAIYVTRLVKKKKSDQHYIGLSTAIVRFDDVRQLISRADNFAQDIQKAIPFTIQDEEAVEKTMQSHRNSKGFGTDVEESHRSN